jgi:hypothetical protein
MYLGGVRYNNTGTFSYESIYVVLHLPSLVRIEPEFHHDDSPTYATLPCQPRVGRSVEHEQRPGLRWAFRASSMSDYEC